MFRIELHQECNNYYELGYQGFSNSPIFVHSAGRLFNSLIDFFYSEFDDKSTIHLFILHQDESGIFSHVTVFYTRKGINNFAFFEINELENEYIKTCLNEYNYE